MTAGSPRSSARRPHHRGRQSRRVTAEVFACASITQAACLSRLQYTHREMAKKKKATRRKKAAAKSVGLTTGEVRKTAESREARELTSRVEDEGGDVLGAYSDPFAATPVLVVALPIDSVEATPYQRDPAEPHVKRLMTVIEKVGRFLDPVVIVRNEEGYWTPNGNHRLQAMRKLGARTITGL